MSFNIKGQIILFNKLDTDEFEFNMKYEYLDYCGKSFLKELSFVEDMEEYFKQSDIILEHFSDHAILTLPIPFSKKVVLVRLNRPEIDSDTEIRIELLKQKDRIEMLEARLAEYDAKEAASRVTYVELDLIYEKDRGFYFDYDGYLSKEGADEKALEQFKEILNDHYGFGTKVETYMHNGSSGSHYGCRAAVNIRGYIGGSIGDTNKYVCDLFEGVDVMLEKIDKPYMNQLHCGTHYICFYFVLDLFPSNLGFYNNYNRILDHTSLVWKKITIFNSNTVLKTDRSPYNEICDALKIKSFKAVSYRIPRKPLQHTKFLVGWNESAKADEQINNKIFKEAKGNPDALTKMYVTDIGPYRYLFY